MFQPNLEKSKFRKALHFGLVRKLERERERERERDSGGASEKVSGWSLEFWFLMTHTSFFNGSVIDLAVPESRVGKNKIT